jgi:hypothetical protein
VRKGFGSGGGRATSWSVVPSRLRSACPTEAQSAKLDVPRLAQIQVASLLALCQRSVSFGLSSGVHSA